jgi:hypothetical protein
VTVEALERIRPLFSEARVAFLSDPSYAIELAKQGSVVSARRDARISAVTLGRNDSDDV